MGNTDYTDYADKKRNPDFLYNLYIINLKYLKMKDSFNNGISGLVEVKITDISYNTPNPYQLFWSITFEDEKGRKLSRDFFHINPSKDGFEKKVIALGTVLKHLWQVIIGNFKIPIYRDAYEMLDSMMEDFSLNSENKKFRIVVDYGLPPRHTSQLVLKKYTPFIEEASEVETKLWEDPYAYKTPLDKEKIAK